MNIENLLRYITLFCVVLVGCHQNDATPHQTAVSQSPKSAIVDLSSKELFYRLTPPCSAGDHYLHIPDETPEYVWLFGANNNGRFEVNVLIERNAESVRLRAFWHKHSGKLYCCDEEISFEQFEQLQSELVKENIVELPNLAPDVTHSMTYWLKYRDETHQHEACGYGIGLDLPGLFNKQEQPLANHWKNCISTILRSRSFGKSNLRRAGFDEQGNVRWDGESMPESEIPSDFFD